MGERLDIGEVTLAYEDTGTDGPTIVFVHGLGGSAYGWWGQLAACGPRGYRGVAYDQRGAGLSDKPEGPYSVERWADDLARLIDGLDVERAALVGHSSGCMVAQRASVLLEDRVWALALCGGAIEWRPQAGAVFEERVRLAGAGRMDEIALAVTITGLSDRARGENPVLHGLMLDKIASNDPAGYAASAQATGAGSMAEMERVSCPTLAFCGAEDPVTPPDFAGAIAAAVPRGETALIEDAAHWCMLERPEAVNDALFGFLDRAR